MPLFDPRPPSPYPSGYIWRKRTIFPLGRLPVEVVGRVCDFLDQPDCCSLSRVCCRLHPVATASLFFHVELPRYVAGSSFRTALWRRPARAQQMVSVTVPATACSVQWMNWFSRVRAQFGGFANVRSLEFWGQEARRDDGFDAAPLWSAMCTLATWPGAHSLVVVRPGLLSLFPPGGVPVLHHLTRLDLDHLNTEEDPSLLPSILSHFPNLIILRIVTAGFGFLSMYDLDAIASLPHLRWLTLYGKAANRDVIDTLPERLPRLQGLKLKLKWGRSPFTMSEKFFTFPLSRCVCLLLLVGVDVGGLMTEMAYAVTRGYYPILSHLFLKFEEADQGKGAQDDALHCVLHGNAFRRDMLSPHTIRWTRGGFAAQKLVPNTLPWNSPVEVEGGKAIAAKA